MCTIEMDDYCEVWKETFQHARKQHRCSSCRTMIQPGDRYMKLFMIYDHSPSQEKVCLVCESLWRSFTEAHDGGLSPENLQEMLSDCVADLRWVQFKSAAGRLDYFEDMDDNEKQWRRYLAALKLRTKVAKREAKKLKAREVLLDSHASIP
jgi:hypothetical protein